MDSTKAPPPYGLLQEPDPEAFLSRLTDHVARRNATPTSAALELEVERVRNLMIFVLSMDYRCNTKAGLSAQDRQHFKAMHTTLADLKRLAERVLHLPIESVLVTIANLIEYTNYRGRYKGSCVDVIRSQGLAELARKLYIDHKVVVPKVIDDMQLRLKYYPAIGHVRAVYFERIHGIEASTLGHDSTEQGWKSIQEINFDANERGRKYASQRGEVVDKRPGRIEYSVCHMRQSVAHCMDGIRQRQREKRSLTPIANSFAASSPLNRAPTSTIYLPDFFDDPSRPI